MVPNRYRVKSNTQNTHDTFTLVLDPVEEPIAPFLPGQFNMLYLFGFGEIPLSISSTPSPNNELVHTIRVVGPVTQGMQKLNPGDEIGVRGPFGSVWPLSELKENILIITGGSGFVPLRPVLLTLAARKEEVKDVTLLYGARTPSDILYAQDIEEWEKSGIHVEISVDRPDETWKGNVGVITGLIHKCIGDPQNTRVYICGPEIMIKFALIEIMHSAIPENEIFLSMERNMKCATGFCGHCQYGPYFVCKDGPVFSFEKVKNWFNIKEL